MAIRQSYKTLGSKKKNTALTAARCRENWSNRLVNNFRQKIHGTHGSCVQSKLSDKSILFTEIWKSYKTLFSKKNHGTYSSNMPWELADPIILVKKSTALAVAGYCENLLRKVCFFTAIRQSYKTLVSKKDHGTHGSKVPWEWPNGVVNNFRQKIYGT